MIAMGDEGSLRAALEVEPGNEDAIVALAELLVARGESLVHPLDRLASSVEVGGAAAQRDERVHVDASVAQAFACA